MSYDGLLEPLGESQVLGYVERLASRYQITVMSYEKPHDLADAARVAAMAQRLESRGIGWIRQRYHKKPPVLSTARDIISGIRAGRAVRRGRPSGRPEPPAIIHARGYVASVIAMRIAKSTGAKFIFDMRGFWADEKVDGGHWVRDSRIYRITKWFERRFFETADAIVSLTHAGVMSFGSLGYAVPNDTPIEVIPTCTDLERFRPGARDEALAAQLGLTRSTVIGVSGTVTNWYLREPMLKALALLVQRLDSAKVLMVTRDDADRLRADALAAGIPADRLVITSASYDRMPDYMRLMDVGLFFIKVCFSKRGSCATKLAEFLATGVPVIINDGIGDSGRIVREHGAGVVLDEASTTALEAQLPAIRALLADKTIDVRCRAAARTYFDVEEGTRTYDRLYQRLLGAPALGARSVEARAV